MTVNHANQTRIFEERERAVDSEPIGTEVVPQD